MHNVASFRGRVYRLCIMRLMLYNPIVSSYACLISNYCEDIIHVEITIWHGTISNFIRGKEPSIKISYVYQPIIRDTNKKVVSTNMFDAFSHKILGKDIPFSWWLCPRPNQSRMSMSSLCFGCSLGSLYCLYVLCVVPF